MAYHVRRSDREITDQEELRSILEKGKYGIIALSRDDEPYAVTLSYGYDRAGNALYFHCAKEGQKIDFIRSNPRACLTVIEDDGFDADSCEHSYRSAVLHGRIFFVDEPAEMDLGIRLMIAQLEKKDPDRYLAKLKTGHKSYDNLGMIKFVIERITGKARVAEPGTR
jgi:uncharacterized protein